MNNKLERSMWVGMQAWDLKETDVDDLEIALRYALENKDKSKIVVLPDAYTGTIGELMHFDAGSVAPGDIVGISPIESKLRKYENGDTPVGIVVKSPTHCQATGAVTVDGLARKFIVDYVYRNQKYGYLNGKAPQLGDAVSYCEKEEYWRVENGEDSYGGVVTDVVTDREIKVLIRRNYPYYYPNETSDWKDVVITGNLDCNNSTSYFMENRVEEYDALVSKLMTFFKLPKGTPIGDMMAELDRAIGYKPQSKTEHTGSSPLEMQTGTYIALDGRVYKLGVEKVIDHKWEKRKEDGRCFGVDLPYDEPEDC